MECQKCRQRLEPHWAFCPVCGQQVSLLSDRVTEQDIEQIFSRMVNPGAKPFESAMSNSGGASYGSGVRAQVFEVIVRQAMAGAPWKEICAGPMEVNRIRAEEVEEEVRKRRGGGAEPPTAGVPKKPIPPQGTGAVALALPTPSQRLVRARSILLGLVIGCSDDNFMRPELNAAIAEVHEALRSVEMLESQENSMQRETNLQQDLERELHRTRQPIKPDDKKSSHHITWKPSTGF